MQAGYSGVEVCFNKNQFNPFILDDNKLAKLYQEILDLNLNIVALSTATTFFLSPIPHEPSLISIGNDERNKRIDVVKHGIRVARHLKIPIVSFQSGYLREYHKTTSDIDINNMLVTSIQSILATILPDDNITLVIEPEPGMYIETIAEALQLINKVNDNRFKLHLDICHAYCSEKKYLDAIRNNLHHVAYMHLANIKSGYNLKFTSIDTKKSISKNIEQNKDGYLYYIQNENRFLFIENKNKEYLTGLNEDTSVSQPIIRENKAYLDSVELVSEDIKEKAKPILNYLRQSRKINKPLCNTIQGKVHYHEFPSDGEIDFSAVMNILVSNYKGYVTVEIYNHASEWQNVLPRSFAYLTNLVNEIQVRDSKYLGIIDHRKVDAPYVRLETANKGFNGDYGCMYDLRILQPNSGNYIDPILMHSMEHALLYYFKNKYKNKFLCLAPMGCQTGFYLVLINQTNRNQIIIDFIVALENIENLNFVPYASDETCGQAVYHDLDKLKEFAKEILKSKNKLKGILQSEKFQYTHE
jgi:S-ribosylhomocysteine lyase LuxS involved in autoinducer biosynthesis/sugar phosphate isomerase/epimerase